MKKILIILTILSGFALGGTEVINKGKENLKWENNLIDGVYYTRHWSTEFPFNADWAKVIQSKNCYGSKVPHSLYYQIQNISKAIKTHPKNWLVGDYLEYINEECKLPDTDSRYFRNRSFFDGFDKKLEVWRFEKKIKNNTIVKAVLVIWDIAYALVLFVIGGVAVGFMINSFSGIVSRGGGQ